MGGADNQQILDEAYRASSDAAVKRAILRGMMTSGDRTRLLSLAKTETSTDLRAEAIQQLAVMRASTELTELYQAEQSVDMKKRFSKGSLSAGTPRPWSTWRAPRRTSN